MGLVLRLALCAVVLTACVPVGSGGAARAEGAPIIAYSARALPVVAQHGMVAAQERRAAEIGVDILKRGGNAVDAAVATGFALAVTLPRAGNLGGGGFMVVHLAKDRKQTTLDFRESAPAGASADMFLDAHGAADPKKSRDSGLGVGTPGSVAGLTEAHARWGSGAVTLAELIAPAIALARDGLVVADDLADSLPRAAARLGRFEASRRIFFRPGGEVLRPGDRLVQADLAATLERIAREGAAGFYQGETAARLAGAVRAAGGILSEADLKAYRPVERPALRGTYRGREIVSMAPPSSGGVHLVELLNMLEPYSMRDLGAGSAASIHLMVESMKLAFADRAEWLGDPDFVAAPLSALLSKRYARRLAQDISPERARPSAEIKTIDPAPFEGDQTTHYSVVDAAGNAVAVTTTLNFSYGLGLVAEGTGVLLNNEMDDFSAKPGAPNAFGLTGGPRNAPAPGKRPLSSMTPTIVLKDGAVEIVTGSPGGPRIITTVLQTLVNLIDHGMNAAEAMLFPRVHHQWLPDEIRAERGLSPDTLALLRARGHKIVELDAMGSTSTLHRVEGGWAGAADSRQRGTAAAGY